MSEQYVKHLLKWTQHELVMSARSAASAGADLAGEKAAEQAYLNDRDRLPDFGPGGRMFNVSRYEKARDEAEAKLQYWQGMSQFVTEHFLGYIKPGHP